MGRAGHDVCPLPPAEVDTNGPAASICGGPWRRVARLSNMAHRYRRPTIGALSRSPGIRLCSDRAKGRLATAVGRDRSEVAGSGDRLDAHVSPKKAPVSTVGKARFVSQFVSHSPPSGAVHQRPLQSYSGRSRTVADLGERWSALLESVLGATPREFESRILRRVDLRKRTVPVAGQPLAHRCLAQFVATERPLWQVRAGFPASHTVPFHPVTCPADCRLGLAGLRGGICRAAWCGWVKAAGVDQDGHSWPAASGGAAES